MVDLFPFMGQQSGIHLMNRHWFPLCDHVRCINHLARIRSMMIDCFMDHYLLKTKRFLLLTQVLVFNHNNPIVLT